MISSIRRRIEKLEAADKRLTRRIIWEDGTGSAEREIATVRAAGESSDVEFIIVSWLPREKVQWTQSMCSRRFSAAHDDLCPAARWRAAGRRAWISIAPGRAASLCLEEREVGARNRIPG